MQGQKNIKLCKETVDYSPVLQTQKCSALCERLSQRDISGFRLKVDEICALLGHYAASIGNFLISSRILTHLKLGPIGCPEILIINYQYSLRNIPEERSS